MRIILAAVDQSRHAHNVVSRAAELASLLRTDLTILSVIDPDPMKTLSRSEEQNRLTIYQRELIFKHFPRDGIVLESSDANGTVYRYTAAGIRIRLTISQGNPVERICAIADDLKADLVIVGNRGLGGVGGLVLGSVSERVVHKCSRSVMVVKDVGLPDKPTWESVLDLNQPRQSLKAG